MLWRHLIQTFGQVQVRPCIWFYRWSWTKSDDSGAQCHSAVILWRTSITNSYFTHQTMSNLLSCSWQNRMHRLINPAIPFDAQPQACWCHHSLRCKSACWDPGWSRQTAERGQHQDVCLLHIVLKTLATPYWKTRQTQIIHLMLTNIHTSNDSVML